VTCHPGDQGISIKEEDIDIEGETSPVPITFPVIKAEPEVGVSTYIVIYT
jgi:hypothetical protein